MQRGFVRIQVLLVFLMAVFLGIIALIAFFSARTAARDQQRLVDITQIQKSLAAYYVENGFYPVDSAALGSFLEYWPVAPQPDGSCTQAQNTYSYSQKSGGDGYTLNFCLSTGLNQYEK